MVKRSHDTLPDASVTIGNAGASQTWDYSSGVVEHYEDTMVFTDPSLLPGAAAFPNANLALLEEVDSTYIFLDKNNSGLFLLGVNNYQMGQLISNNIQNTLITLPATMGTSYTNTESFELFAFPLGVDPDGPAGPHGTVDSLKTTRNLDETSTVDAWGQITTPFGTFSSIRQNKTDLNTDTTWQLVNGTWEILSPTMEILMGQSAVNISTEYSVLWWSNDPAARFPVMEMSHDNAGTVFNVTWLKETPTAELSSLDLNRVLVYPNPALDVLIVGTPNSDARSFTICDIQGSIVAQGAILTNNTEIELSQFNGGVYFVYILDKNAKLLHESKLVVRKQNK